MGFDRGSALRQRSRGYLVEESGAEPQAVLLGDAIPETVFRDHDKGHACFAEVQADANQVSAKRRVPELRQRLALDTDQCTPAIADEGIRRVLEIAPRRTGCSLSMVECRLR